MAVSASSHLCLEMIEPDMSRNNSERNYESSKHFQCVFELFSFFLSFIDNLASKKQKLPQSFNCQSFACDVLQFSTKELLPEVFPQIENCPALGNRFLGMELETMAISFGTVAISFGIICKSFRGSCHTFSEDAVPPWKYYLSFGNSDS